MVLVAVGLREAVMNAIPLDMRRAIGVGIGLFIAFIGAVNARLVVVPTGTVLTLSKDPTAILPPVTYGTLRTPETAIAVIGLIVIVYLLARRFTGAIIIGILISTAVALLWGIADLPQTEWVRVPRFETAFQADIAGVLGLSMLPLLLSIVMVDFFDTIGTVTAIAEEAGLADREGGIPGLRGILFVDALSASIGGMFGASSVTSYVESAAGVAEGARTGLHSVFVGLLFLFAIFAAPVMAIVPPSATAPALIVVGFLMCTQISRIDFDRLETAIPSFLIVALIPFTYSISHGIGYGFIAYVAIEVLARRGAAVHPLMYGTAAAFAAYFIWG